MLDASSTGMVNASGVTPATCLICMRFSPGDVARAIKMLHSSVGTTEAKRGCLTCSVARDTADENLVRYSEMWDSEPEFRRHVQSEEFRRVLTAMDMCCEEPQVLVGGRSGRDAMEYLQVLRCNREEATTRLF
jgi:quinol monooxygenase YgiN